MTADRGSVTPLIAGFLALTGVMAVSVIDSTDLALARTALQSLADGAALAGAQSFTPSSVSVTATGISVTVTNVTATSAARAYLKDSGTTGIALQSARVPDSHTAVVTLARWWSPPFVSDFIPVRVLLKATARARTRLG